MTQSTIRTERLTLRAVRPAAAPDVQAMTHDEASGAAHMFFDACRPVAATEIPAGDNLENIRSARVLAPLRAQSPIEFTPRARYICPKALIDIRSHPGSKG